MVLEWTLGLKRLAYSSVSLHLKRTWETQNHQTFCVNLVLVSITLIYRAACSLLVKHSTMKREPQRFQATSYWVPEDQGTGVSV